MWRKLKILIEFLSLNVCHHVLNFLFFFLIIVIPLGAQRFSKKPIPHYAIVFSPTVFLYQLSSIFTIFFSSGKFNRFPLYTNYSSFFMSFKNTFSFCRSVGCYVFCFLLVRKKFLKKYTKYACVGNLRNEIGLEYLYLG